MAAAVASGACDVVGLGRPLTVEPDLPASMLAGTASRAIVTPKRLRLGRIDGLVEVQWHEAQMHRLAAGEDPAPDMGVLRVVAGSLLRDGLRSMRRLRG